MTGTPPTSAGRPKQPASDLVSELRTAAAAFDAAWAPKRTVRDEDGHGDSQAGAEGSTVVLVHQLRQMAALCSMAARMLLERAGASLAIADCPQRAGEAQAVCRFLETQLAAIDRKKEDNVPNTPAPGAASPANGQEGRASDHPTG